MKRAVLMLLCATLGLGAWAQQGGVEFRHITFLEALQAAKRENKPIFMDCYTEWCGPCKRMANEVFPQTEAGDYFNNKFVCVKYDMEKGEAVKLCADFKVQAFPTFIIISPEGREMHRFVGGSSTAAAVIARAEEAFDPDVALGSLRARYDAGERDREFLAKLMKSMIDAYCLDTYVVAESFADKLTDEEKTSQEYWNIYSDHSPPGSKNEAYLLAHRSAYETLAGKDKLNEMLFKKHIMYYSNILYKNSSQVTSDNIIAASKEIPLLESDKTALLNIYNAAALAAITGDVDRFVAVYASEQKSVALSDMSSLVKMALRGLKERFSEAQKKQWVEATTDHTLKELIATSL